MSLYEHPNRTFEKPEDMWKAFEGYLQWAKDESKNWPKIQYVGKDGKKREDFPVIPLSIEDFKTYCWNHHGDIGRYLKKRDDSSEMFEQFAPIVTRIRDHIRGQQIRGGLLAVFNPNLTARINGIKDVSDVTTDGKSLQGTPTEINVRLIKPEDDED